MTFKVGDKVKRTQGEWLGVKKGDVCFVKEIVSVHEMRLNGHGRTLYAVSAFELVEEPKTDNPCLKVIPEQVIPARTEIQRGVLFDRKSHEVVSYQKDRVEIGSPIYGKVKITFHEQGNQGRIEQVNFYQMTKMEVLTLAKRLQEIGEVMEE